MTHSEKAVSDAILKVAFLLKGASDWAVVQELQESFFALRQERLDERSRIRQVIAQKNEHLSHAQSEAHDLQHDKHRLQCEVFRLDEELENKENELRHWQVEFQRMECDLAGAERLIEELQN